MKWTDNESSKTSMGILNRVSGVTLWEEMVRDRKEFCLKQCQVNKVVNMLRPKCTERRYLDVLLLKQEPKKGMPRFCYGQRVKELNRSFKEGHPLLSDIYVYIEDYYSIVHDKHPKSRRTATDLIKRSFRKSVDAVGSQDYLIETHYVREMLFILWPKLEFCLINAQDTSIHSLKMFQSIVETLAESFALEVEMEIEGNFIELRFANLTRLADSVIIEEKLQKHSAFTGYSGTEVWAEVHLPSVIEEEDPEFRVKDLHAIFKTVSEVSDIGEDDTSEKEMEEVSMAGLSDIETHADLSEESDAS